MTAAEADRVCNLALVGYCAVSGLGDRKAQGPRVYRMDKNICPLVSLQRRPSQ